MLNITSDGIVRLTRGDTAKITVDINNDFTGQPYEIQNDDVLKFTVKKTYQDNAPAFQIVNTGSNIFCIQPTDTKDLAFGVYIYDVQLELPNGEVYTVIPPTDFELMKEVCC